MTDLLLGIDIGTSSSKGVLVNPSGEIVARASKVHRTSNPRPGWFEHDAEQIWWADFCQLTGELLTAADGRVAAVAVSGIGPCLLPADAAGTPLRPAILYGVDSRAGQQIVQLNERLGAEQILQRAGSPLTSQAVGPKLLWLRQSEPEVFERTDMVLMASSFLVHRLTGRYVLDHQSASQCTPLYDLDKQAWNTAWCEEIAPGVAFPELLWTSEVAGVITDEAAARTALPAGIPVTAGTIDAWAEATSVGVRGVGDVMIMYGTTTFMVEVVDGAARHPGLWCTAGVWPNSVNLASTMATSGAMTTWLRDLTAADYPVLMAEAEKSPPGGNGLLMLPYFAGEQTPTFDARARGVIAGLTLGHTRGDLYRAALEATAYGVRRNLEAMADAAASHAGRRVVAVGGGTTGGLWTQIMSDITGHAQLLPTETVGASFGNAMLAGLASGLVDDVALWNRTSDVVTPNPDLRGFYDEKYRQFRELDEQTRGVQRRLADDQLGT